MRYDTRDTILCVFTLKHREWECPSDAYKALLELWRALRQNITREWGKPSGFVSTVEMHADGYPHVNVVLVHPLLATMLGPNEVVTREDGTRRRVNTTVGGRRVLHHLRGLAVRAGFGWSCTAFTLNGEGSREAVAGYITKTSTRHIGEVIKAGQLPVNAPRGFRRHRSSRGFLPPIRKGMEWTGTLKTSPLPPSNEDSLRPAGDLIWRN